MITEELFAAAKQEIFGEEPDCAMERLGRRVAISYFSTVIRDAEPVRLDLCVPHSELATLISNAFTFSGETVLDTFPVAAKAAIDQCAKNFRTRYEPLLEELTFKAA